jgi:tetratricopeptide (TPR) repeat protein
LGIATISAAADDRETCWKAELGDEAIAACSRLISSNPGVADHFNRRGNAYYSKHDYDRALSDYDQAIQLDPKFAVAYNNRGNAYNNKHDYDRAISDYDQAIQFNPKFAIAYNGRGSAYRNKGEYDRAISDFDEAIQLDPKYNIAYNSRGLAYNGKGEYDRAISDLDQAIRLDPKPAQTYNNRCLAYYGKGEYDRAISDCDQAIRLNPNYVSAYNNRGMAYNGKGEYDHAIADLDNAIQLGPTANHYSHRGFAYGQKGDFDRAMAELDKAIALDPKYARGYSNRAAIHLLRGDRDHAMADYQTALRLDPGLAGAADVKKVQVALGVQADRRVALVIGNSGYTSSLVQALPNPRRDAKLVADALRQAGFDATELMDLGHDGMVQALRSFRDKADNADWALVYFAGHGIEINRANYLLPVDAKLVDSRDVELEAVSYEAMLNAIGGAKALRIIILDACRNNPFKAQMRQTAALRGNLDRGLAAPPETEPGTLVVYSAKEGQAAVDGEGVNSPFAQAFVARLKMPGRELRRMFDDVRDDVLEATSKRQQPYTYGSVPGRRDFYFVAGR